MTMDNKKKLLVTHDGSFHTDDVFAAAILSIYLENKGGTFEIIRTRDEEIIKNGDYVFDVGGVYDAEHNRFDHHQNSFKEKRGNEIIYSSFGLVWKKFGEEVCGSQKVADSIDKKLVVPVDAWDNAIELVNNKFKEVSPYFLQYLFFGLEPTWKEIDVNIDDRFMKGVGIAKEILMREIVQAQDALEAEEIVMAAYQNSKDKRIIILDKNYPCQETLQGFPEPLYVVYPRKMNNWWGAKAVRQDPKSFMNRKDFPRSWGALRDEELQKITEVSDAVFCHKGLYMVVAKTREGAIALAQKALGE